MAKKTYGAEEARTLLPDLLERAHHGKANVITKRGKPYARDRASREPFWFEASALARGARRHGSRPVGPRRRRGDQKAARRMVVNLAAQIPDGVSVLMDTNPIIYLLEGNRLGARVRAVFSDIDRGRIRAVVTPITIAEVVSGPLKAGKDTLAERYRRALTDGAGWSVRDIDTELVVLAARVRLRHKLKLPDALQLAAAVSEGCYALVTHDRDFRTVTDLPILGMRP
jgi:predicted nucleic acid-binding protein/antitoxin (DNA-binding transcriptional repressor) of toxin-antitoxin stability system